MRLKVNGPKADAMTVASAKLLHFLFAYFLLLESSFAFITSTSVRRRASKATQFATRNDENASARRQLLSWGLSSCSFLSLPSSAFENKVSDKYDDRPKRRGPQVTEGMLLSNIIKFFQTLTHCPRHRSQKTWVSQCEMT
jgi:hypothetical protein